MRPHFPFAEPRTSQEPLKQEGGFSAVLCDDTGASPDFFIVIICYYYVLFLSDFTHCPFKLTYGTAIYGLCRQH